MFLIGIRSPLDLGEEVFMFFFFFFSARILGSNEMDHTLVYTWAPRQHVPILKCQLIQSSFLC